MQAKHTVEADPARIAGEGWAGHSEDRGADTEVCWISTGLARPAATYSQEEIFRLLGYDQFAPPERRRFHNLFAHADVETRGFCVEPSSARSKDTADALHQAYLDGIADLAPTAARQALARAGLAGEDLDFIVFVSCTGYSVPGYGFELGRTLGMPMDHPAFNLLGMGCSGLVPGLNLAFDRLLSLQASQGRAARGLVVAAEVCSATPVVDHALETGVANAIFADGAAAILLSTHRQDRTDAIGRIDGFHAARDTRYLHELGYTRQDGRMRVRLAGEVPRHVVPLVQRLLEQMPALPDARLVVHPGGRKILDDLQAWLAASPHPARAACLESSRAVLRNGGNMSSPTVAFVAQQSFAEKPLAPGEKVVCLAMGPGLSVEGMVMTAL